MNQTRLRRWPLRDLWSIHSHADFHRVVFDEAIHRYLSLAKEHGQAPGSVLAIGAVGRDAVFLGRHPFERIVLSGITEPDDRIAEASERDPRISYEYANAERLPFATGAFDLVFCKATLHHLTRPVLGLYEILRVCRRAAIAIEPWDSALGRGLDRLGWTTRYEREQAGNLLHRDNYVYRWGRRELEQLLRSLYLESAFEIDLRVGWLSTRFQVHRSRWVRRAVALASWAASFAPGARGNLMTALLVPGRDLPPDPTPGAC